MSAKSLTSEHNKTFITWFKDEVMKDLKDPSISVTERLISLAYGPNFNASFYAGYVINGCTFYTREKDNTSTMQNSGVTLVAEAMHFASAKDNRPIHAKMHYYGVIEEICELHYSKFSITLFGCKWANNNHGIEIDDLGYTFVNMDTLDPTEDPFILATQAKQVFYVTNPTNKKWSMVIKPKPRHEIEDCDDNIEFDARTSINTRQVEEDNGDDPSIYTRNDHDEGIWITKKSKKRRRKSN